MSEAGNIYALSNYKTGANAMRLAAAIPSLRRVPPEEGPLIDFPDAVRTICVSFGIKPTAWISFVRGFRGEAIGHGESSSLSVLLSPFRCLGASRLEFGPAERHSGAALKTLKPV